MDLDPDRDPGGHRAFSLPILFKQQEIPVGEVTIKATGNQWYWSYEYVDEGMSFDSYMIGSPATGGVNMMTPEVEAQLTAAGYTKSSSCWRPTPRSSCRWARSSWCR
jgi:heme/copper-type cytochrome/quinol oxidase subunit 2